MAQIPCAWCGFNYRAIGQTTRPMDGSAAAKVHHGDVLRGILTCGDCGEKSVFELKDGYALTDLPGKDILLELNRNAPTQSREMYEEARLCFFGAALRAAAVMGRACLEQALVKKGYTKGKLEEKIDEAKKKGDLYDREVGLAHSSRLVGNDAIHEAKDIIPACLLAALAASATITNHLFP